MPDKADAGNKHFLFVPWLILSLCFLAIFYLIKNFDKHPSQRRKVNTILIKPKLTQQSLSQSKNETLDLEFSRNDNAFTIPPKFEKSSKPAPPPIDIPWQSVVIEPGESLSRIFKRLSLPQQELIILLQNKKYKNALTDLKANQVIKLQIHNQKLCALSLSLQSDKEILFKRHENRFDTIVKKINRETYQGYYSVEINNSLFEAARKKHIPHYLIQHFIALFSSQIDFSRDIHKGDKFTLIYEKYKINGLSSSTGPLIAATITRKQKTLYAFAYKNKAGEINYFDNYGHSLKKAFDRYPLKFSHISSNFNYHREHPILGVRRPHKGIDLAANIGTPIKAVSDGKVIRIGHSPSYGNVIVIKHNQKYETLYAHMHHFKPGISKGKRVKRGQVIGFVGQTGLAAGPHCHFEFHVNGIPVNPARLSLPRANSIDKKLLKDFSRKTNSIIAQLKIYQNIT